MNRNSLLKEFSYKMTKYRESLGYSIKRMAKIFGVATTSYTRYEKAMILPDFYRLYYIAIKTGISLDWLVCDKGPMYYTEKMEKEEKEEEEVMEKKEVIEEKEEKDVKEEKKIIEEKEETPPEEEAQPVKDAQPEPAGKILDEEINELVEHMERIPLLRHEILVSFYKFKEKNKKMVEAAEAESPQPTNYTN